MIDIEKIIYKQLNICSKHNVKYTQLDFNLILGISDNISSGLMPINGLRHPIECNTSGWYIWAGEYSYDIDFFKPIHIYHLLDIYPDIVNYLALPPGWRFLIDNRGYEDVWEDQTLLNI